MRLVWCTDPHLNFVENNVVQALGDAARREGDALLVTGDIAEANSILSKLTTLQKRFMGPVYFVAGNHDFYGSSIAVVEEKLSRDRKEPLIYLTSKGVIELSPEVGLVGDDGWYDARNGNITNGAGALSMNLYDFTEIAEIKHALAGGPLGLKLKLHELGDRATARARPKLVEAIAKYKHIIFATHIPPFAGAAWFKGKPSEPYAQPFFSSKVMGDMLFELAVENPDKQFTVLCGHSHFFGTYRPCENMEVTTGFAQYYKPCLMRMFEADNGTLTEHKVA